MSTVRLLCGPPGSGKTRACCRRARQGMGVTGALPDADRVVYLAPTPYHRQTVQQCLLTGEDALCGLFDPRLFTFRSLAEAVLEAERLPVRVISTSQRRLLLGDLLSSLSAKGQLTYPADLATGPGFIQALAHLLDEFNSARLQPADLSELLSRHAPKHPANHDVLAIYAEYQERLKQRRLHDSPGILWQLGDQLAAGARRPLERMSLLIVDGFARFTVGELTILEHLIALADETLITLSLDRTRPDLFAEALRTEALLQQRLGAIPASEESELLQTPDGFLATVATHVFTPERKAQTLVAGQSETVRFIGAPGPLAEVRALARDLKQRLRAGLQPDECAVVVRSLAPYERALANVFSEYGLPLDTSQAPLLGQAPAVQAIQDVLRVVTGDFRRDDVVQLLNSSYVDELGLQPDRAPELRASADELECFARQAGIIGGLDQWRDHLALRARQLRRQEVQRRNHSERDPDAEALPDSRDPVAEIERLESCVALFQALMTLLQPLRQAVCRGEAVAALSSAIEALGLTRLVGKTLAASRPGEIEADERRQAQDLAALQRLFALLREYAEADEVLRGGEASCRPQAWAELDQFIAEACASERLEGQEAWGGGVALLEAEQTRGRRFRHVTLAGLTEGLFPCNQGANPFYNDEVRQQLNTALGYPALATRDEAWQREPLLFAQVLSAATETLTLTWPAADATGRLRLHSHFLEELAPPAELTRHVLSRQCLLPRVAEAASPEELLIAAFAEAAPGDGRPLLAPGPEAFLQQDCQLLLDHVLATATVERGRQSQHACDAYDGVLGGAQLLAALTTDERFGPGHEFSASQLSNYAVCPIRFFFQYVLGLQELVEPDEELESRETGTVMHRVLSLFFGEHRTPPATEAEVDKLWPEMERLFDQSWRELEHLGLITHRALADILRAGMLEDLRSVLRYEVTLASGKEGPIEREVLQIEYSFGGLPLPVPEPILMHGRLDRLDVVQMGGRQFLRLLDYKGNEGIPISQIKAGLDAQMPVYQYAARQIAGQAGDVEEWAYYRYRRPAKLSNRAYAATLGEIVAQALPRLGARVRELRQGQFTPAPRSACPPYCGFGMICRHQEQRCRPKLQATAGGEQ